MMTMNQDIYQAFLKQTKPKSLGELWIDEDKSDSGEDDVSMEDVSNDEEEDPAVGVRKDVKFLPSTAGGLTKRFNKLICEFTRQDKVENRNELVFLLDEMLRHELIAPPEYEALNNILAESLGSGVGDVDNDQETSVEEEEEMDEGQDIKKLIQSTTQYLVKDDKKELMDLIADFKKEAGKDIIDVVNEIEKLIERFIDGELVLQYILDMCRQLENSSILLSKQQKLKMLINNIDKTRYRIHTILTRLHDEEPEEEDIASTLSHLTKEELLSPEEYQKLTKDDVVLDLPTIASIIKENGQD